MNPKAKQFFEEHPDAKYWYFSQNARFPNPEFWHRPDWESEPWPVQVTV